MLRSAADDARERVCSSRETHLRLLLRRHGLPPPVTNHEILDPAAFIAHDIDLAYPGERLTIEHDGDEHLTDASRVRRDHRKSAALHAVGWAVIRFNAEDPRDPTDLLARLDRDRGAGAEAV